MPKLTESIRTLRDSTTNWLPLSLQIWRGSNPRRPPSDHLLRFRSYPPAVRVRGARPALNLARYWVLAHRLGIYSTDDLRSLQAVFEAVDSGLWTAFPAEDRAACRTGGGVGMKEVVLHCLVRKYRPRLVIETGVAQGVSSYVLLNALQLNGEGRLVSIDLPNRDPTGYVDANGYRDRVFTPTDRTPGWLVPESLRGRWTLKLGRSGEILPTLDAQPDLFFHDSEHSVENMLFEFEWARERGTPGGLLVSDDIGFNDAWARFRARHPELLEVVAGTEVGNLRLLSESSPRRSGPTPPDVRGPDGGAQV